MLAVVAVLAAAGCSSPSGAVRAATAVDTQCQSQLALTNAVQEILARYRPSLDGLSQTLAASSSLAENQRVMGSTADILVREARELRAVRAGGDDQKAIEALAVADDDLAGVAGSMRDAPAEVMVARRQDFLAAARRRNQAVRMLQLHAEFAVAECAPPT